MPSTKKRTVTFKDGSTRDYENALYAITAAGTLLVRHADTGEELGVFITSVWVDAF